MILFVNGCVRENSRTLELAQAVLAKETDTIEEVRLYPDGPEGLDAQKLSLRDELLAAKEYGHPMFNLARQFAEAEAIVLAAPYWDLAFPAKVRAYLEEVTVSGVTFRYGENGIPQGLCKAKRLVYVTTAGGPIGEYNLGFDYVKALATLYYGIPEVKCFTAEFLDIIGADVPAIMAKAKQVVDNQL